MSIYFYCKNGQGKISDEDVSLFHLETLTNFTEYEKAQEADKAYLSESLDG
jgi:hypothetical protein